jgi:hypothetical protein
MIDRSPSNGSSLKRRGSYASIHLSGTTATNRSSTRSPARRGLCIKGSSNTAAGGRCPCRKLLTRSRPQGGLPTGRGSMTILRLTITPTPWNGTSTSRTHIVDAIEYVLVTAFTAFRAAALESARSHGAGSPVVVHAGFWGCGAFGGHRVLMTTLQVLAAEMAGLHQIVLHTGAAAVSNVRRFLKEHLFDGSQRSRASTTTSASAFGRASSMNCDDHQCLVRYNQC